MTYHAWKITTDVLYVRAWACTAPALPTPSQDSGCPPLSTDFWLPFRSYTYPKKPSGNLYVKGEVGFDLGGLGVGTFLETVLDTKITLQKFTGQVLVGWSTVRSCV